MAIRRVDPSATFKVISQYDDALIEETKDELEALKTGKKIATGQRSPDGKEVMIDETRPTRFEEYIDTLDESKLKLKEGYKPTYFIIRCLRNSEVAELNERHIIVDPVLKKVEHKNRNQWFMEHFEKGCIGILEDDGTITKVTPDDLGFGVAIAMGSVVSLFTSLGKHLKKS